MTITIMRIGTIIGIFLFPSTLVSVGSDSSSGSLLSLEELGNSASEELSSEELLLSLELLEELLELEEGGVTMLLELAGGT